MHARPVDKQAPALTLEAQTQQTTTDSTAQQRRDNCASADYTTHLPGALYHIAQHNTAQLPGHAGRAHDCLRDAMNCM
jgi:hypothetical protein